MDFAQATNDQIANFLRDKAASGSLGTILVQTSLIIFDKDKSCPEARIVAEILRNAGHSIDQVTDGA